jgi:methionyl-tRNA synthetase
MANRYLGGERPAPQPDPAPPPAVAWASAVERLGAAIDACLLHEALAAIWEFVGVANKRIDADQPWVLAKAAKDGDEAAAARLRLVLGDVIEACRLIALAAAPFLPTTAPKVLAQLGYDWPYADDGNGGPPLLDELRWGAHAGERGALTAPEPLFPRLETETASD